MEKYRIHFRLNQRERMIVVTGIVVSKAQTEKKKMQLLPAADLIG